MHCETARIITLVPEYTVKSGVGMAPDNDDMLTIAPFLRSSIWGRTILVICNLHKIRHFCKQPAACSDHPIHQICTEKLVRNWQYQYANSGIKLNYARHRCKQSQYNKPKATKILTNVTEQQLMRMILSISWIQPQTKLYCSCEHKDMKIMTAWK